MKKTITMGIMIAVSTVHGGVISSGDSAPMMLDLRTGARESMGDEALTYSSLWDGGDGATVTIAQDGVVIAEGLTGEGERTWSVQKAGTYVLTHTTYTNGVAGKVETATFVVTGKDVPFAAGDVTVSNYSNKYDGAAHGIGVTVADGIAGVSLRYASGALGESALPGAFSTEPPTLIDVGSMTVWCEIAAPGYITQTNSATVTITKRAVTLTSGDASKVYDGTPVTCGDVHIAGDGFVTGESATFNVTGSQTSVGTSENAFTYTLNDGTKAGNYDISTVNGTLAVTKATVGPGGGGSGGDEPGGGEVPTGGESKFDTTWMYDGEGHTIDTNALVAAFGTVMIGELAVAYAEDDGSGANGGRGAPALPWGTVPAYTNAGEYVVWYRVSNPNYNDFIHAAKVTITNRPVTVTSADGSWTYDGQPHSSATVSTEGFVDGEGVVASNFATITGVGSVANAFDYAFADGTLADNYAVTCVTGTLTIVAATIHYVADNVTGEYNGTGYGIDVSVSAPASGAAVKFAESAEGPWLDSLAYVDVCEDRPIYFQITATGYTTAVDSRTVTVTPKTLTEDYVWLVLPWEDYVYDGTAKEPEFTCGDGEPSIITLDDFDVSYLDNIDAGTATAVFTGKGNYTGTVTEEFDIWPREVTFTSGSASKVYDGTALVNHEVAVSGDGFIDGEGVTFDVTGSQTNVGASENAFTYTLNEGTKASNYDITTVNGTLTVTKASAGGEGGEEPGGGAVPQGGESKFDVTAMYDGEGHTIDTNALVVAFGGAVIGEFAVEYAADDGSGENGHAGRVTLPWLAESPVYTNAGEYVVWYRVSNPNYEDFVHAAKVTITNRPVTVTSADGNWTYDGQPHSNATVTAEGFVDGEGIVASNFATITDVGSVVNAFDYMFADGTLAENYAVTCVTGTLTISEAYKAFVIRCEWIEDAIRPATMDFMVQTNGAAWQIEAVTSADDWKKTTDVKVYDQGVPIDYGLVALPAEGIRSEIEKLGCRTVGSLSGLDNVLTESGWNNVGSSTMNTVVGTVDGWRRFGELRMSDLVIAEDTSKGVFFKVCNFKSTFDIDDGTDGTGGEASRFSYSGVYDGVGHGIGVEVANAPSGMTVKYARGNAGTPPSDGWSAVNPLFTNVCDRAVVWYAVECAGYVTYTNSATVTISPKGVAVRADAKSRPYGQPDVPLTYTAEGLVAGDALGGALSRDPGEAAGTYAIRQGTLANANYAISYIGADYVIAKIPINPANVFGGEGTGDNPLVCEKTFNGAAQPVEIVPNFDEPYQFLWALTEGNENAYSATAPTLRNVADGELTVFFKFVTANYEPYYGKVVFRILAKELTDEMVVLSDEAFYYDPGSTVKKPSVTVADTNALGEVISTANDYTVAYENATAAGAIPVTVTAKNNYFGTVTKTFPVLKRPVAPPVIGTKAYNGRTQKATVTTDSRWTVVRNNGGVNVGEYEVVLRLTNTEDYRWKGVDEAEAEWTGVFRITKANNGWSRYPGMTGWTYGETPNEPVMGQARYGTVQVAYRRKGTDVSTETATKPSTPGMYIARFWVDETENHIGVALSTPYEIEFEIAPGAGGFTETQTTPVPVPYVWLDSYLAKYGHGDYEAAGHATGANGCALWESYVAGLNPEDPTSKFRAFIEMLPNGAVKITWSPDLSTAEVPRTYTILGKAKLTDADWTPVTDANKSQMRFFKVKVEIK